MSRPRKHNSGLPDYVRIRHGSYHYRDKKVCRVDAGEAKLYEELAKLKALPSGDLVPAAVAAFKADYLPTLSPTFRDVAKLHLDRFAKEFREYRVDEVTAVDMRAACKDIYGDKKAMALAFKSRASRFFRWCIEEKGLLKINPCREVWLPKPKKYKTPWTDALFWAVRDKFIPMMQCYHDLSFLLYQRSTDVRHLMASQIKDGVIHFEPSKTEDSSGAQVDVPITSDIQAVLDRARKLCKLQPGPRGDAPVIQTSAGTRYTRGGIYSAYRRADEALHGEEGIVGLNPKALRPYAATTAEKQGFSLKQLQVGLAHTKRSTTEGYIHQHEVQVSEVTMALPARPKER